MSPRGARRNAAGWASPSSAAISDTLGLLAGQVVIDIGGDGVVPVVGERRMPPPEVGVMPAAREHHRQPLGGGTKRRPRELVVAETLRRRERKAAVDEHESRDPGRMSVGEHERGEGAHRMAKHHSARYLERLEHCGEVVGVLGHSPRAGKTVASSTPAEVRGDESNAGQVFRDDWPS
jgi:hypothetical protein